MQDNSESIDAEEFRQLCKALGYEFATKADVDNAMKMLDDDNSGTIEWDEFAQWWMSGDKFSDFQHLLDDSAFFMDDKSKAGDEIVVVNEEESEDWPPLMLHPYALFRTIWDGLSAIAIVYSAIFVPLRMSFALPEHDHMSAAYIFDKMVDLSFMIDMVLSFFTAYYDPEHEEMVTDRGKVTANYLKSWFVPDFLATVPFDEIAPVFMGPNSNPEDLRVLKLIRLLRLLKIMRIVKMSRLLNKLQEKLTIKSGIMMSIKFTLLCFATAHYLACGWFVMSRLNPVPWARCNLTEVPDFPQALSLDQSCPKISVYSFLDVNGTHRTTAVSLDANDTSVNGIDITAFNPTPHTFQLTKTLSSWIYKYFIGSRESREWHFRCDANSGRRYFMSQCNNTRDGFVMAGKEECLSGPYNEWLDDEKYVYSCMDVACLSQPGSGSACQIPNCKDRTELSPPACEDYDTHSGTWDEKFPEKDSNGNLANPLGHVELYVVYWSAFYWSITTMTTLGYGEINPADSEEQFFVMFAIMIGVVVFAYGITNMCTLVANLNAQEVFAQTRSDEIIEWMSNNNVPDHFKKKVMQYFTYKISYSPVFFYDGETLLEELSPELKKAVLVAHFLPIVQYSALFSFATSEALADSAATDPKLPLIGPIIEALQCEVFFPGETIVGLGLYVRGCFFFVHGNVTVTTGKGEQLSLEPGECYGEYALKERVRAAESVQANAYLDTFVLEQADFAKILKRFRIIIDTFDWDAEGIRAAPEKQEEVDEGPIDIGLSDGQNKLRELQALDMEQEELIAQLLNTMDKQDKFGKSSIADGV
eukprot:SAG22_NODE_572_length_9005_cov_105.428138_3_plen_814_part_00